MDSSSFSIFLLLVLPPVVGLLLLWYRWLKPKYAAMRMEAIDQQVNRLVVSRALKLLACKPTWETEGDEMVAMYTYQSGHFIVRVPSEGAYIQLSFLFLYTAPLEKVELVRYLCNQFNSSMVPVRIIYTIDEKVRKVHVHELATMVVSEQTAEDQLEFCMGRMFELQRAFAALYQERGGNADNGVTPDMEKTAAEHLQVLSLIHEQELVRQPVGNSWRIAADSPELTVRQLLDRVVHAVGSVPVSLTVAAEGMETHTLTDAQTIAAYDVETLLLPSGAEAFARQSATATLVYREAGEQAVECRLAIVLTAEQTAGSVLYYRLTLMTVPTSASLAVRAGSRGHESRCCSFLVAHDLAPVQQSLEEFRYMWKEARALEAKGDYKAMTPAQRLISLCTEPDIARHAYRGEQLYLDKRPYEALPHLYEAYRRWSVGYDRMSQDEQQRFFEVCYLLGSCHAMLQQYAEAVYYLELTLPLRNSLFVRQYINCLVNGGDIRALAIIDGMMKEVCDDMPVTDLNEHDRMLYHFLRRRKVTVLVNKGKEQEAERILHDMLDEPDNADYAIAELAYLHKKKTSGL